MDVQIDRRTLNLIVPVDLPDGSTVYVHSSPVNRLVYEAHFELISRTYSAVVGGAAASGNRVDLITGAKVSALMLRKVGHQLASESGQTAGDGGASSLMAEIHRTTAVLSPTGRAWETLPLEIARARGIIDDEDAGDIDGALVFFTCASHMMPRRDRKEWLPLMAKTWSGLTTPLTAMEYGNSLPISTPAENSGAKATPSSIPS